MALVRYEPWNLLARLHAGIDRTVNDVAGGDSSGLLRSGCRRVELIDPNVRRQS